MVERVWVDLTGGRSGLDGAVFRYGVLERLRAAASRRGVTVLAFGYGAVELRVVFEGGAADIGHVLRGLKVGTVRSAASWGVHLVSGSHTRVAVDDGDLCCAVAWAHMAPDDWAVVGPLASPWTSHRDLMGFRLAGFYDPAVLEGRVDPRAVHAACGGRPLPDGWPPPVSEREALATLLRVAGAVLGVLPADRRCFRLFVHLARARGYTTAPLADALTLTRRRVRQLAAAREPHLELALTMLCDCRLAWVP